MLKYRRFKLNILATLLGIFILITFLQVGVSGGAVYAAAETTNTEYTAVLEDLEGDTTFDIADYPENANDYSLDIITLAESSNDELFVYVYQPSGSTKDLRASSINISTDTGDNIRYFNYRLKYINSDGVFYKYLVQNFTVLADEDVRYYAITSIYRPFDDEIDEQPDNDNTITEVNYDISRQYGITADESGQQIISMRVIETIVVTDKFVGYVNYPNGFSLNTSCCHSYFVAFSTDKPIEKLIEADVYYTRQGYSSYTAPFMGTEETWSEISEDYAYLTYTDRVEHSGSGVFPWQTYNYTWNRIETVEQFIDEVNNQSLHLYSGMILNISLGSEITPEAMIELQEKQWVLRFAETNYYSTTSEGFTNTSRTLIGNVTILRLKFETDGKIYNLGVIDNKQTGSDDPINNWSPQVSSNFWLYAAIMIAAIIVFYVVYRIINKGVTEARQENATAEMAEYAKRRNSNARKSKSKKE